MSTTTLPHHPPSTPSPHEAGPDTQRTRILGRYRARDTGQRREIVLVQRPDGSALLIDYQHATLTDARLVAHLAPEEPQENARILCELYLADESKGRCRRVTAEDFHPASQPAPPSPHTNPAPPAEPLLHDADGHVYRIRTLPTDHITPELRWTRSRNPGDSETFAILTLREVVARLEAYEPARTLTAQTLTRSDTNVCTSRLQTELQRLATSTIVLNRALREAVQREIQHGTSTMSDIAVRCGRTKRNRHGTHSGETSWLARRIGQRPEPGATKPCPWIHSDVLALIARQGLCLCPREVEL